MADASAPVPSAAAAARWLAKANEDLAVAELIQQNPSPIGWAVCFHSQQSAEKALKSVLVLFGVDFPRSHALGQLAALLPPDIRDHFDEDSLATLTPWAVAGRYPEEIAAPDEATTNAIVTMARQVVAIAASIHG